MIHYFFAYFSLLSTEPKIVSIDGLPQFVCARLVIYPLKPHTDLESLSNIYVEVAPRKSNLECGEFFGDFLRSDAFSLADFIQEIHNAKLGLAEVVSDSMKIRRCFESSDGYRIVDYVFDEIGHRRVLVENQCGRFELIKGLKTPLVVAKAIRLESLNIPD
jgi:hypothetical protein